MANIDRNLSYTFVTSLDETDSMLTSDYFLVSEPTSNSQYLSKKLPYSRLCSLILVDVNDKIQQRLDEIIGDLSTKIELNVLDIQYLSGQVDQAVTAIIKVANCVQMNKSNIQYLSSILSANTLDHISCGNGIRLNVRNGKYEIGHSNSKVASQAQNLYKIGYDEYGHISSSARVLKSDITSLGIPAQDTTYGIANTTTAGLVKLANSNYTTLDRYRLSVERNGNAYTDVPVHQIVDDAISEAVTPAGQNHLGVIALCAEASSWGNTDETYENVYPLLTRDNYAYVQIPPPTIALGSGTLTTTSDEHTITSISYANGAIEAIGQSNKLSSRISNISSDLETNFLNKSNTALAIDSRSSTLQLKRGGVAFSSINIAALQSETDMSLENFEVVQSYVVEDEDESVNENDNPALRLNIQLNGQYLESYADIPYEDWIFTLDDGTTVTKRVTVHSSTPS